MLRCKLCRAEKHITIENFGQSFYETSQLEYVVFIHLMNQSSPGGGGGGSGIASTLQINVLKPGVRNGSWIKSESKPPDPTHFTRSRSRDHRNILLAVGVGVGLGAEPAPDSEGS